MWSYLWILLGVSVTTGALLYLDSRLFDRPKNKLTYFKAIAMTNVIVFATMGLLMWLSPSTGINAVVQSGGSNVAKITGGETNYLANLGEEVFVGEAPF